MNTFSRNYVEMQCISSLGVKQKFYIFGVYCFKNKFFILIKVNLKALFYKAVLYSSCKFASSVDIIWVAVGNIFRIKICSDLQKRYYRDSFVQFVPGLF